MNPSHLTSRWLTLFLIYTLFLPNPALALRPEALSEGSGLEELSRLLPAPVSSALNQPAEVAAGLEEISPSLTPGFLKYTRALARRLVESGNFRIELYEDGSIREVAATSPEKPAFQFSFGEGLAFLIAWNENVQSALVIQSDGTLFSFSASAPTNLRPDPPTIKALSSWQGKVHTLLGRIGSAGGVQNFVFL